MSQIDDIQTQQNELVTWMNAVIANGKTIDALPAQSSVVTTSEFAVRNAGVTEKLTLVQLLAQFLLSITITIAGLEFRLIKSQLNDQTVFSLEENDVILGYDDLGNMMFAIYLGGDETDFQNVAVYKNVGGWDV